MHPRTLVIVLGWDEVIALDAELLGDVVQVVGPGRIDVDPQELPLLERLDDMLRNVDGPIAAVGIEQPPADRGQWRLDRRAAQNAATKATPY